MRKFLAIGLLVLPLQACLDNDIQRGLLGAGAGGLLVNATGGNVYTGVVLGGLFGTLCDDLSVCGPRY